MGGSVSSLLDPNRGRAGIIVPDGYTTPQFPSLYLPSFDNTQGEIGVFLYEAESIWHFTLYWTLLLVVGIFFLCSLWASFTLLLSLTTYRDNAAPLQSTDKPPPSEAGTLRAKRRLRRKRPPFWPLIVLPLVMSTIAALVALISGTIVGFSLAAVYSAGGFTMSTWVPFLWGLIQVIVLVVSSYSTLTSIL